MSFVNLAQAIYGLLLEHESGVERKVPGHHSTDKTMLRLTERNFTERIPPPERKAKSTKRYVMCYKQGKIRETVLYFVVLTVKVFSVFLQDIPHQAQLLR
jgi:hypothetical protein